MKPFANAISDSVMQRMLDPQLKDNADLWEAELSENGWFRGRGVFRRRHHHELSGRGGDHPRRSRGGISLDQFMAACDQDTACLSARRRKGQLIAQHSIGYAAGFE